MVFKIYKIDILDIEKFKGLEVWQYEMFVIWVVNYILMCFYYNVDWLFCRLFFVQSIYFRDIIEFINKLELIYLEFNI